MSKLSFPLCVPYVRYVRWVRYAVHGMALAMCVAAPAALADATPYQVVDGNKVDARTMSGWRTWRALACERCHGAQQEGAVGPALTTSMKGLSKEDFKKTVLQGRIDKGMPNFDGSQQVVDNIDNLYAYLKGRSDGAIAPGKLQEAGK